MNATAKIGLFALAVLLALAVLVLKIEDLPFPGKARAASVEVTFKDVAGLDDKSAVRIAGVRVGKVDGIRLLPDGTAVARLVFERRRRAARRGLGPGEEPRSARRQVRRPLRGGPDEAAPARKGRGFPGASPWSSTS